MFKDIIVPQTGSSSDDEALGAAVRLARALQSHLTVLELVSLPYPMVSAWGPSADVAIGDLHQQSQAQGKANVSRLNARLRAEHISHEVRLVQAFYGAPAQVAAQHAVRADISVISGVAGDTVEGDLGRSYFGSLLISSGRPVLVIPKGSSAALPPATVVVAWTPTRASSRALHDALPMLQAARSVHLIVVVEDGDGDAEKRDMTEITAHLDRHGVAVQARIQKKEGARTAALLLEHAARVGADMLVVGGFGHSRFREWAFGGVTRELLFEAKLPILYSH
ncbi:universal stress protein [Stenotrophomonas indicatrix]|uniref:universal stress protein n=1 Tax=Stenotrophomonas indicatrix TaxID=2045451 RepID=UPI000FD73AA6|nr:universal stress protein [Stenotrophomonas indicatrix]